MADAGASASETPSAPEPPQASTQEFEAWEAAEEAVGTDAALVVSLDGFEGPLDVLLALARTQKVDLAKISVLALADQGWRDVARSSPDAMAGKGKAVQPFDRDGKTLYRTYVTGFSGVSAAQAFCDDLRAAGRACMVK